MQLLFCCKQLTTWCCLALQIVTETIPALQKLKDQGLVKFIGITGLPLDIYTYVLDRCTTLAALVMGTEAQNVINVKPTLSGGGGVLCTVQPSL